MTGPRWLPSPVRVLPRAPRRAASIAVFLLAAVLVMGANEPPARTGPSDCPPGHELSNVNGSLTCVNTDSTNPAEGTRTDAQNAAQAASSHDTIDDFLMPQIMLASGLMMAGLLLIGMGLMGRAFREIAINSRTAGSAVYDHDHPWLERVAKLQVGFGLAASSGGFLHGAISWLNAAGS